jgi:glycosyltransferase involved in cell wall biosynthesis
MFEMPLVSIVIHTYNHAHFLRRCIDKALAQRYRNIEVVVYDDASTDNSRDVLRYYDNDPRVKVVLGEINRGITGAVAQAIHHSTGEFFTMCASDDTLLPNQVDQLIRPALDPIAPADLVWGNNYHMGSDGKAYPYFQMYRGHNLATGERNEFGHQISDFYMAAGAMLIRRSAYEEVGGFDPAFEATQEHELPLRFAATGKRIIHVTQPSSFYVCHQAQFSRTAVFNTHLYKDYLQILERYLTDANAWKFRGYEARILSKLNGMQSGLNQFDHNATLTAHQAFANRIVAYAQAPAPQRPNNVPRVSVVAICDDEVNTTLAILDTLEQQTYRDWELVLIQYGSVSMEGLVLDHPVGNKVNHIYAPTTNSSAGWAIATERVRGELVTYLEPETLLGPDHIAALVNGLDASGGKVIITGTEFQIMMDNRTATIAPRPFDATPAANVYCRTKPFAVRSAIMHRFDLFNHLPQDGKGVATSFYGSHTVLESWEFIMRCEKSGIPVTKLTNAKVTHLQHADHLWYQWVGNNTALARLQELLNNYPPQDQETAQARDNFVRRLQSFLNNQTSQGPTPGAVYELMTILQGDFGNAPQALTPSLARI